MPRNEIPRFLPLAAAIGLLCSAQATASTYVYEGRLDDGGRPADGRYDLSLTPYPAEKQGATLAAPMVFEDVEVRGGQFRLEFDLPAMNAEHTWLELGVRDGAAAGDFAAIPGRAKAIAAPLVGACWSTTGDTGVNPATNFLGTIDNQPFVIRTRNAQSLRIEPSAELFSANPITANVVAGSRANVVDAGVRGATISGGGVPAGNSDPDFVGEGPNRVTDHYGAVGGGYGNRAGDASGITASAPFATVGGGAINTAGGFVSTIGGGSVNTASGVASTIGGGETNVASGEYSTVAGGDRNTASGDQSTVTGGLGNTASGRWSTTGGGDQNCAGGTFSWAGGRFGKVRVGNASGAPGLGCAGVASSGDDDGDGGTFIWSDSQDGAFQSTGQNQFLVRAAGGMAINTNTPAAGTSLTVNGATSLGGNVAVATSGSLSFGSQIRQMINLWGAQGQYGIGVQDFTQYFRADADAGFAWFSGGSHVNAQSNPGPGGRLSATLTGNGGFSVHSATLEPSLSINYGGAPAGGVSAWTMVGLRSPLSGLTAGSFYLGTNAAARFGVQPDGVTRNAPGVWATFSDARLKKNIRDIESPLDTYLKLRGHWFEYIDPKAVMADEGERMGFVAQEVRAAVPQWVREGEDGILSVVPTGFEALTVEAVRQLHDENATIDGAQSDRIAALEAENAALRARLEAIEARFGGGQ